MFELEDLVATTSEFMDRNAKKVLASEDFLHLSSNALVKLVEVSSHIFISNKLLEITGGFID